jgi:hypothetical protein
MKFTKAPRSTVTAAVLYLAAVPLTLAQGGPEVTLSTTNLNFGQLYLGEDGALQVTALSSGDADLTFSSYAASGSFAPDPADSDCLQSFAPGTGCKFGVLFYPTTPGAFTGTFSIYDNATNSPQTVALTAKATALKISPSSLTFGTYSPGQTSPAQTITITNVWTTPVTISGMSFSGSTPGDFPISNQTCLTALAASASCTFAISFAPSVVASQTATLTISDDEPGGPDTVTAQGDGTYLLLTPRVVQFTRFNEYVTVRNTGSSPITVSSMGIRGRNAGSFEISGTNCESVIAPGVQCSVAVGWVEGTSGSNYAQLYIVDNEGGSPQVASLYVPD